MLPVATRRRYAPAVPGGELTDKVFLITGGAQGIGLETARIAIDRGARVALVDLDPERAREAAGGLGPAAIGLGADVVDPEAIAGAVAGAVAEFGRVDVVVANAGITPPKTTTRALDDDTWRKVVEVNVLGVYRTVVAGLPEIVANRGQVAIIASSYSHVNGVLNSSYAVSKSAVEAFARGLSVELAAHGAGVTTAFFGYVDTGLIGKAFDEPMADQFRREVAPAFMTRPIQVGQAAEALVDGIAARRATVIEPGRWRIPHYLRGLLMPLTDRRLERDLRARSLIRQIEDRDLAAGGSAEA
ncbi:MAG: SDR family NAD(P)-dependent oxidoreductase [Solirubrobacterales bacterium]|nr:SDR family NAD(P)-dependent oxidoreductase [Solirubrobacterales bacterium]